ncbi:MAG: tetratricopeptide repeat protein [Chloroflexi bacterium]|nr:tetratricopeptide repeat protein [Chloroflexota bacterium]
MNQEQGWQAIVEGRLEDAVRHFQQVLDRAPDNAGAWHGLGVAYHQLGRTQDAYQALRKSLALDPRQVEAWHALAQVADAQGYTLEARDAAQKALQLAREQNYPPDVIRGLELTERQLAQALRHLARAFGVNPETPEGEEQLRRAFDALQKGLQALQAERAEEAVEHFREGLKHAPDSPILWSNLGVAHMLGGRWDDAERALQQALALDPSYEPARFNLEKLAAYRSAERASPLLHGFTATKRDAPKRESLEPPTPSEEEE